MQTTSVRTLVQHDPIHGIVSRDRWQGGNDIVVALNAPTAVRAVATLDQTPTGYACWALAGASSLAVAEPVAPPAPLDCSAKRFRNATMAHNWAN